MKPHIIIAIQDANRFFTLGVQHILQAYFQAKGCTWSFVPITSETAIDLMVWAKPSGWPMQGNRLWEQQEGRSLGTIVVREKLIERVKSEQPRQNEVCVLGRRERPEVLVHLVAEMFERACFQPLEVAKENSVRRLSLTPRERDILQGFCWELTPSQIASRLSLSVKTISTHKLTAMRKLGFKRNSELYYWLRQGGLGKSTW